MSDRRIRHVVECLNHDCTMAYVGAEASTWAGAAAEGQGQLHSASQLQQQMAVWLA